MRALLQRVTEASVRIDGEEIARIGPGLLAMVGVGRDDTVAHARALAATTAALRVFAGQDGGPERSVTDTGGAVLVVSQFTLMADTRKGHRPSWSGAAPPHVAQPLVGAYVDALHAHVRNVVTGRFGADMQITLTNDGPVTVILER
jgi:D-tyrosyl-tRNA(Tyr) deacylase